MRYIDDVLYLIGWVCMIAVGFSCCWQIGTLVLGVSCWVSAVVLVKSGVKIGIRDKPGKDGK